MRLLDASSGSAEANLVLDEALLEAGEEVLRFWEIPDPVVVVGRSARLPEQVLLEACRADGVSVLRRSSGGGAVVLAAGCLNYSMIFSLQRRPAWHNVRRSVCDILGRLASALQVDVREPCDLALADRKVAGSAQRRTASSLLHHGTLLYRFDAEFAERYLLPPPRQPAYRQNRSHSEFLANLPLSAGEIRDRITAAWSLQ